LKRARPPKPNLTGRQRTVLRELQDNRDIYTVPADKGNATVILDSSDYSNNIHTLLSDPTYEPTNCNPIKQMERQTKKLIQKSSIPIETQKLLTSKDTRPPTFYGLKKSTNPMFPCDPQSMLHDPRPRYLHWILLPTFPRPASYIQNCRLFVQILSRLTITALTWNHFSLKSRHTHLNSRHPNITFSMELEGDHQLPFLDVLVNRRSVN
jgi:hypothetical protein